jgi:hypothetical protein
MDPIQTFQSMAKTPTRRMAKTTMKVRIAAPHHREESFRVVTTQARILRSPDEACFGGLAVSSLMIFNPITGATRWRFWTFFSRGDRKPNAKEGSA